MVDNHKTCLNRSYKRLFPASHFSGKSQTNRHFTFTILGERSTLPREATIYTTNTPSIDLTRFPAADFTTIVIPKKHTKPRRKRTAFSNIQLHFLEQFFQKKAYPSSQERNFIGSILNIGSGQVKTWYQNRRTKMKKNKVFDFGPEAQESTVSSTIEENVNRVENNQLRAIAAVSSTLEPNVKCFHLGIKQPYTMPMTSLNCKAGLSEVPQCDCYKPNCIGNNVLLHQRSVIGHHP